MPSGFLSFVHALFLSILTPLFFFPSSSVCLSYFILAVPMRGCLGKHSYVSSQFPIAKLNGTSYFLSLVQEKLNMLFSCISLVQEKLNNSSSSSSSSSSSRDGLIGPLPAKCRPKAFDAHSFTTFRERGKTG